MTDHYPDGVGEAVYRRELAAQARTAAFKRRFGQGGTMTRPAPPGPETATWALRFLDGCRGKTSTRRDLLERVLADDPRYDGGDLVPVREPVGLERIGTARWVVADPHPDAGRRLPEPSDVHGWHDPHR